MSVFALGAVGGTAGYLIGRWWVALLVPVLGLALAGIVNAGGASLDDTPLPFAVLVGTAAALSGFLVRRQVRTQTSSE